MDIKETEKMLVELKVQQSDVLKKKKADRATRVLAGIRSVMAELKQQAKDAYAARQKEQKAEAHQQSVEATNARKAGK